MVPVQAKAAHCIQGRQNEDERRSLAPLPKPSSVRDSMYT